MSRDKKQKAEQAVYIPQTESAEKQKVTQTAGSNGNVVVALCHPTGIQFLLDGGKRRVKLNGNAANLVGHPKGILPVGGFGLTEIPRSDWEAIKAHYGRMEIFKNGLCFAHDSRASVTAEADEKAELRHGREPVAVDGVEKTAVTDPADAAALM